jgi:hypothetical protein
MRLKRQAKTVQEKAIELLYSDYEQRIDDDMFLMAIKALEVESKARVFIVLRAGDKRDRWLETLVRTVLMPALA